MHDQTGQKLPTCVQHSFEMHVRIHFADIACVEGKCAKYMQTYL